MSLGEGRVIGLELGVVRTGTRARSILYVASGAMVDMAFRSGADVWDWAWRELGGNLTTSWVWVLCSTW